MGAQRSSARASVHMLLIRSLYNPFLQRARSSIHRTLTLFPNPHTAHFTHDAKCFFGVRCLDPPYSLSSTACSLSSTDRRFTIEDREGPHSRNSHLTCRAALPRNLYSERESARGGGGRKSSICSMYASGAVHPRASNERMGEFFAGRQATLCLVGTNGRQCQLCRADHLS